MKYKASEIVECVLPHVRAQAGLDDACHGPLLFSIYVNTLPDVVKQSNINLYADDTALFASAESVGDLLVLLNDDLSAIGDWLRSNCICLNYSKSVSMLIGSAHSLKNLPPINVSIHGNVLTPVEMVKYLGVYVDHHLTWDKHIENLCQRARSKLFTIQRLLPLPSRVITLLYNAYVFPLRWHVEGCSLVTTELDWI